MSTTPQPSTSLRLPASRRAASSPPPPSPPTCFLGRRVTPLTRRRVENFRTNRRGFWSLWIFLVLFAVSLFAEFVANDRPILIRYDGGFYLPILHNYSGAHLRRFPRQHRRLQRPRASSN